MERSVTGRGGNLGFMAAMAVALADVNGSLVVARPRGRGVKAAGLINDEIAPEKYAGQSRAYLRGAWLGDGVPSQVSTKLARDKRRLARRLEKVRARARMGLTG